MGRVSGIRFSVEKAGMRAPWLARILSAGSHWGLYGAGGER